MRRLVAVSVASTLMIMLLPSVASAKKDLPDRHHCIAEARQAHRGIGLKFAVGQFDQVILGTNGDDMLGDRMTLGADLVCGFGGADRIESPFELGPGDIYVAAAGYSRVDLMLGGTVIGGGPAEVLTMNDGIFIGGTSLNAVGDLNGGWFIGGDGDVEDSAAIMRGGTLDGGEGRDVVSNVVGGTFNGGTGPDYVAEVNGGRFNGGAGDDQVNIMRSGTFDGGDGIDSVLTYVGGTVFNVP